LFGLGAHGFLSGKVSKPWKKAQRNFQGLENFPRAFPMPGKTDGSTFQSSENLMVMLLMV
jgi:hypothetical protein